LSIECFRQSASAIIVACLLTAGLNACGSAEKYQKEAAPEAQSREFVIPMPPDDQVFARGMTEHMDAAELAVSLGDSVAAVHTIDSLLGVAEAIVDTIAFDAPLNRFLLFFMNDGYVKISAWEPDTARVAALTRRYEELAVRLQERRDSFNAERDR
jgi:hypothetical protein